MDWTLGAQLATGGAVRSAVASEALPANRLVYIKADGQLALANATAAGKEALGFVRQAYNVGETAEFYMVGNTMTGLAGLTPGAVYYMSTAAGELATAAQVAAYVAGNVRMEVGTALSATELLFKPDTPIIL